MWIYPLVKIHSNVSTGFISVSGAANTKLLLSRETERSNLNNLAVNWKRMLFLYAVEMMLIDNDELPSMKNRFPST